MAGKIWVVLQHRDGKLHRMAKEAIAAAQRLAREGAGDSVEAVLLGSGLDGPAAEAGSYELAALHRLEADVLAEYTPGGYVSALRAALEAGSPSLVVFPHTYQTVDYMPRLAQEVDATLIPEVTSFEQTGEGTLWERPILGGKLNARVRAKSAGLTFVSVQSGAFATGDAEAGAAGDSALEVDLSQVKPDRQILGVEEVGGEQVDLSAAEIVVAAGRGVGGEDKMGVVHELAAALGAEIGASRPVIDNGWLPRDRQIGSSGQTVAAKLYFALGISGAIQHLVGMKGSQTIVAINKDPGAPIFSVSHYGLVGDLHEIVPALTAAIREAKAEN